MVVVAATVVVGDNKVVVVGARVVVVVVVGTWNVIGADARVAPWAWTVTSVVPNGRSKLSVVDCPAGSVTGAGDTALVPLNVIVNSVEPSAADRDELSVIDTDPPVAVAAPAVIVAVEAEAAGTSKSYTKFVVPSEICTLSA